MLNIKNNIRFTTILSWFKKSFFIFRESPIQFIVLSIFSVIFGFIPFLGSFLTPIFNAKYMQLTYAIENNNKIPFSQIFNSFFANSRINKLGLINFCLNLLIFLAQYITESIFTNLADKTIIMLLFLCPVFLLQTAMWLSPIICLKNDATPKNAMLLSIKASLGNVLALISYSVIVIMITIMAFIPLGLGLLIWIPVLNITAYFIYQSIFNNH